MCWRCNIWQAILSAIVILFALWPIFGAMASQWIIVIAAAISLIVALTMCNCCSVKPVSSGASRKKRR